MSRFSVKSILLGIGIGIVFMSVISMIYLAGRDPDKDLTEKDISRIAEKYNLVKKTDGIDNTLVADETGTAGIAETTETTASTQPAETTQATVPTETSVSETTGTVSSGEPNTSSSTPGETGDSLDGEKASVRQFKFTISYGATSEGTARRLLEEGLIENKKDFVKLLGSLGLSNRIQVGEFLIPEGASMQEIAKIITSR